MVEVINVTSMDAVATEDVHTVSNNDVIYRFSQG